MRHARYLGIETCIALRYQTCNTYTCMHIFLIYYVVSMFICIKVQLSRQQPVSKCQVCLMHDFWG